MHSLAILVGAGLDFDFNRLKTGMCYNVGQIIVSLTWMSLCSCQDTSTDHTGLTVEQNNLVSFSRALDGL